MKKDKVIESDRTGMGCDYIGDNECRFYAGGNLYGQKRCYSGRAASWKKNKKTIGKAL